MSGSFQQEHTKSSNEENIQSNPHNHTGAILSEGLALLDPATLQVLTANETLANILGRPLDKVIGCYPWEWDARRDQDDILKLRDLVQRGVVDHGSRQVTVLRRPDGTLVNVEMVMAAARQNDASYLTMSYRDTSMSATPRPALEKQMQLYRQAMANMYDGVVLFDAKTHAALECNQAFARMLGYDDPSEIVGLFPWDWDIKLSREQICKAIPAGASRGRFETRHRRRDGSTYDAEISFSAFLMGSRIYTCTIVRDVTEIKRAQMERDASELRARLATEGAGIGIWEWNACHDQFTHTPHMQDILEMEPGETVDEKSWLDRIHPDDLAHYQAKRKAHLDGRTKSHRVDIRIQRRDGTYKWVNDFGSVIERDPEGQPLRMVGTTRDINARKTAQAEAQKRQDMIAAILGHMPGGVLLIDDETGRIEEFNDYAALMHGYSREEFAELKLLDFKADPSPGTSREQGRRIGTKGKDGTKFEDVHKRKDGTAFDVHVHSERVQIDGRWFSLTLWTDISELKKTQRALKAKESEMRSLVENSPDLMVRYDRDLRRIYINPSLREKLGASAKRVAAKKLRKPSEFVEPDRYAEAIRQTFLTGCSREMELETIERQGERRWYLVNFTTEYDASGEVASVLVVARDITELVAQRKHIQNLAYNDVLTGLVNRTAFNERFAETLANCRKTGVSAALLVMDLDKFKYVNDSLGHVAGDKLLHQIAARLSAAMRPHDVLARLGGDEFAILLPRCTGRHEVDVVIERIHQALGAPFDLFGREIFIAGTTGVAFYPDDGESAEDLFAHADAAMYNAKSLGSGGVQFYTQDLSRDAEERLAIISDLKSATAKNEFELLYQPKVTLTDGACIGAEALLRWQHPEQGTVSPSVFIPIAEETGSIVEIGRWVLKEACRTAAEWNRISTVPCRLAVNLSSRQFIANDIVADVREALAEAGCSGEWLECEITESLVLHNDENVQDALSEIKRMGVTVAIDDFGTGQSALSYLDRFRVDVLKIDRSFVGNIEREQRKTELVKAFISVADALEMETVAEGIESREQMRILQQLGCRIGQGYHFSRPLAYETFKSRYFLNNCN